MLCLGLSSTVEELCVEVPGIPLNPGIFSSPLELRCPGLYLHIKKTKTIMYYLKKQKNAIKYFNQYFKFKEYIKLSYQI